MSQRETGPNQRRSFLKQMTVLGGSAPFAPAVLSALAGSTASSEHAQAQAQPAPQPTNGHETVRLAQYVSSIRYEDLPADVLQRAKDTIIDAVAVIVYGAQLPWSRIVMDYARRNGSGGKSRILGGGSAGLHAPSAALANGALSHAFEMDNLTKPDSGAHPGAILLSSTLAVAQERGIGGRELLTAFVAGAEAMIRIGLATKHTNEIRGFHAPGTTGPFGGAVAVGHMLKFSPEKMTNALGIAGSLSCGLLEFAKSGTGGMVKKLHLGRGAEGGVMAASLAAEGYDGPNSVLEGAFGFLKAFCTEWDVAELTKGLGETYVTRTVMMKRFACHITAHTAVEALMDLRAAHKFTAADVAGITIAGSERMATLNNILDPKDVLLAQFSIPFSVSLSMFRDPLDPRNFDDSVIHDAEVGKFSRLVKMVVNPGQASTDIASTVTVTLKDGRTFSQNVTAFKGTPERPLDRAELREKFLVVTRHLDRAKMLRIFERLQHLETEKTLDWLSV